MNGQLGAFRLDGGPRTGDNERTVKRGASLSFRVSLDEEAGHPT
jgi:hypothetical protein